MGNQIKSTQAVIVTAAGEEILLNFDDFEGLGDTEKMEFGKKLIALLAKRHDKSLLVVTYMYEAQKLQKWAAKTGILPPEQIQWFGALRGKNDYEHLQACLVLGTHLIPPIEIKILAQIWNWQDPIPVDFAPAWREGVYQDYRDPVDHLPRAHQYQGYADERVNKIFQYVSISEMIQCQERIRGEVSDDKSVYYATEMACQDHVNELASTFQFTLDLLGDSLFSIACTTGGMVRRSDYMRTLIEKAKCAESAARDSYSRVAPEWADRSEAICYSDPVTHTDIIRFQKTDELPAPEGESLSQSLSNLLGEGISTKEKIRTWLMADSERAKLSHATIADIFKCSVSTVRDARRNA